MTSACDVMLGGRIRNGYVVTADLIAGMATALTLHTLDKGLSQALSRRE